MIFVRYYSRLSLLTCFFVSACGSDQQASKQKIAFEADRHQKEIKEQFVHANQLLMQKENDDMDVYVKNHRQPFIKTASGIRYFVYEPSIKGDSIKPGNLVKLRYKLFLLDGTLAYSSDTEGEKELLVGEENIESGIHKGLQLLKRGDKALLIIPSPLAHGLLGDMDKIPPQMPIVYDLEVN